MKNPSLYQMMARSIDARMSCIKNHNLEWEKRHEVTIYHLMDSYLPHGSGIDATWKVDFEKSSGERLVFYNSFHRMNDTGMYDGWIDFTVVVKPSLMFGCIVDVVGKFGRHQDLKDYLIEMFNEAFTTEAEV